MQLQHGSGLGSGTETNASVKVEDEFLMRFLSHISLAVDAAAEKVQFGKGGQ